jgi:hypothetical protein
LANPAFDPSQMAYGNVETFVNHLKGAFRMVQENGGPDTLPVGSFIKYIYQRFMDGQAHCYGVPYTVVAEEDNERRALPCS